MRIALTSSAVFALLAAFSAHGSDKETETETESICVEVEVNGQHIPAYDCLTNKLNTANDVSTKREDVRLKSEQTATRPSNAISLFNRAATSQRMGNAFGKSATAQRPPTLVPVSPIIKRP